MRFKRLLLYANRSHSAKRDYATISAFLFLSLRSLARGFLMTNLLWFFFSKQVHGVGSNHQFLVGWDDANLYFRIGR